MKKQILVGSLLALLGMANTSAAEEATLEQKARKAIRFLEKGDKITQGAGEKKYTYYLDTLVYKDKHIEMEYMVEGPYTKGLHVHIRESILFGRSTSINLIDAEENNYGSVDAVFVFGVRKMLTGKKPVNKAYEKILDLYLDRQDPEKYFTTTVQEIGE